MLIFDAHLDLSLNALEYNRDLRQPLSRIRSLESDKTDLKGRGRGTVCFPEMRAAGIGLCVATQIGGCMKPAAPVGAWNSPEQAWAMTQGQLAWYRTMEDCGALRLIRTADDMRRHIAAWEADPDNTAIGYVLSLEGADSIRTPAYLESAYNDGLRALGPAHYGIGRYAYGHDQNGRLSDLGQELLREMDRLGLILDVTHLCDATFWDAMELYTGPVWASHHNCRALADDPRQLSDKQILAVAERDGVIGLALDAWMVVPGWIRGKTRPQDVGATLEVAVNHIDHICQLLGNVNHVGIGTDLDGGFGTEQTPTNLDSIADVRVILDILQERGYSEADIRAVASGNFVRVLEHALD